MGLFNRKQGNKNIKMKTYDKENQKPVLKCSICNGEQVAAFQDVRTGKCEEVMFIRGKEDLELFRREYGIEGEIPKIY